MRARTRSARTRPRRTACRSCERPRSVELQVGQQPVQPALAAVARLLVATKRRRRVEAVERVRPHHARAHALGHPQDARPLVGHTPADRPYGVLFAFSTASSGVRKVSTESTGPKISSRAIRYDWETFVNSVGGNQ